ncbi:MAG: TRAP transporter substrate-binding protein DctP [Azospirillaceae bacterium]
MSKRIMAIGPVSVFALAVSLGSATAQDPVTLRVADALPASHYVVEYAIQWWMDEVSDRTDGAVSFEYYPAQQLGSASDILSLTQSGVADIGYVVPSYVSDRMPLSGVAQLPGGFSTSCEGTEAFWQLITDDGMLAEQEFAPNGMHVLIALVQPPYQMFTTGQPLTSMDDMSGLKIRTTGGAMDITMERIDAIPVRMPGPEILEALERGTIDGGVFPPASVLANDWQGTLAYGTVGASFGSFALTYSISEDRWNALPADIQQIMTDAGREATFRTCEQVDEDLQAAIEDLRAAGVTMEALPEAEQNRVDEALAGVSGAWAADLDAQGEAGTEVLEAFRAALSD